MIVITYNNKTEHKKKNYDANKINNCHRRLDNSAMTLMLKTNFFEVLLNDNLKRKS